MKQDATIITRVLWQRACMIMTKIASKTLAMEVKHVTEIDALPRVKVPKKPPKVHGDAVSALLRPSP